MIIKLSNWERDLDLSKIKYPIIDVPTIPLSMGSIKINCDSSLLLWFKDFIEYYGDGDFIKLKEEKDYTIMRIYNSKYMDAEFRRDESVDSFGGSLD